MAYLYLRFENANLIVDSKNKHVYRDRLHIGSYEYGKSDGHDMVNPIPSHVFGAVLTALCGEIPSPTNRVSIIPRNEEYYNIAASHSYINYTTKPYVSEKNFVYNKETFSYHKSQFDATSKAKTYFTLADGTIKEKEGVYNWDLIKRGLRKEDLDALVEKIKELIQHDPLSLPLPTVVHELSRHYGESDFKDSVHTFIERVKGKKYGRSKAYKDWVWDVFFNIPTTTTNTPMKSSTTPILINRGLSFAVSLSGTIICEITDDMAHKIHNNCGVAHLLESGIIYVIGCYNYEPEPNYKDFYEKIY